MPTFFNPEDAQDPLTRIILRAVPENALGNKTLSHACTLLGVTKWAMRKWINKQKLTPERAMQIVEMSKTTKDGKTLKRGRVTLEDLHDFVYNS